MIWPFCPRDGMLESLTWRTSVIRAFDTQQRARLVDVPRRTFNAQYTFDAGRYERARQMMRQRLPSPFEVPDWGEFDRVTASAGASSLVIPSGPSAFVAGGRAIVWANDSRFEAVTVDAVADGLITLTGPLGNSYQNAVFAPLLLCDAPNGMEHAHTVQPWRETQVEWNSYAGPDLADIGSPPTYRGYPILTQPAKLGDGTLPERITRATDRVDNGMAVPFLDTAEGYPVQTLGAAWQPMTRADRWSLRRWFYAIRGRQSAFWLPSWNHSIRLGVDVLATDTEIRIEPAGLANGPGTGDLFLRRRNGSFVAVQFTDVEVDSDGFEVLTLTGQVGEAIAAADLYCSSLMWLVCLAADRVEFEHRAGVGPRVITSCEEIPVP